MGKNKLERFAEMSTFQNVIQPHFNEVYKNNHKLKGKWKSDFFHNNHPIVLELGCGKGEYTIGLARKFPYKNFIGVDIKGARMWKGAKIANKENISNAGFLRTRIELISSCFEENEIDEIWLTFSDPQPKKKKKRLTSSRFLNSYMKFLKPGGIIHLKTDNELLYQYSLNLVSFNKLTIIEDTDDLYGNVKDDEILGIKTFYEKQFLKQGKKIHYLKFKLLHKEQIIEPLDEE